MKRFIIVMSTALLGFALVLSSCDEEEKNYNCDQAIEKMYDEDCELWCQNNGVDTIYLDECAWYDDDDPYNFDQSVAEDICDELQDQAEDEHCEDELQDMLNCLYKHAGDDCAEDCEDPYEDLMDCIW